MVSSFNLEESVAKEKEVAESTKTDTRDKKSRKPGRVRALFHPLRPVGKLLIRIERWKPIHFIGLVVVPRYVRNSFKELKLVTWPSFKESRRLTTAVIIFATVFGLLIAVTDYGLDKVFKKVILKQ